MTNYIIRRLLILPLILFGVTLLIFLMLTQLSPGQRLAAYQGDAARPGHEDELIKRYGLDKPIYVQYAAWIGKIAHGDLGFSKTGKERVTVMIRRLFPATLELALWSTIPLIPLSVWLGMQAALQHNKPTDQFLRLVSILGTSVPAFVSALLLLMVFGAMLKVLPTGGRLYPTTQRLVDSSAWTNAWAPATGLITVDALLRGNFEVLWDALRHLVMPVVTLSALNSAVLLRVTRSSMLDTLRQDYVRTAMAKGLSYREVVRKHARPNALLPVITQGGLLLVSLMGGAAITETIFDWPGIGRRVIQSAGNLDVVTVLGLVMFLAVLLIVGNLIVDVLYAVVDPRIRLS
ncbi:MAG: ABC transporter permease [Ardenticatenales bacterium]